MIDLDPDITKKFFAKAQVDEISRFESVEQLLKQGGDICFIHALDPDICPLAIKTLDYDFKALFQEEDRSRRAAGTL